MNDKRGFHFLVGLAVLWFGWRLYKAGIIFAAVAYATGVDVCCVYGDPAYASGPGAIIVAFLIEAIITIGWVMTLSVSGIWDGLLVLGRFIGDGFGVAHGYVVASQVKHVDQLAPTATPMVAPDAPVGDAWKTPEQQAIEMLSSQLVALAAQVQADKSPAKKVTK